MIGLKGEDRQIHAILSAAFKNSLRLSAIEIRFSGFASGKKDIGSRIENRVSTNSSLKPL